MMLLWYVAEIVLEQLLGTCFNAYDIRHIIIDNLQFMTGDVN